MHRAGFAATLVAGVGLLGASLHGMTGVDRTLAIAAATPAPPAPRHDVVLERHHRDCERRPEGKRPGV